MTKLAKQGCEYCKDGKRIKSWQGCSGFAEVSEFDATFRAEIPLDWGYADAEFQINYCPMCGEKLEAEAGAKK